MTDEMKTKITGIIGKDSNEQLLNRFVWYGQNYNPVDFDRCDTYEMIKAEILRRMEA